MSAKERLWTPSLERIAGAGITRYRAFLAETRGLRFDGYESLWRWSVDELEAFWASIWEFCGVRSHAPYSCVLDRRTMPGARWFPGATLNYAEHALAPALRPGAAG
ncbi:MAG TPA: acetyl-coenzyme A synthetase N-terminal domain-containing protein, partial [Myxococcales bacterium]|nr:acetyl-coenzyme A synthetase N-terminal domain-containing protein [Myxococcales bacterium]